MTAGIDGPGLVNDLLIGVSFFYFAALSEAATAHPERDFGIIDVSYSPPIENVESFIWYGMRERCYVNVCILLYYASSELC